MSDDKEFWGFIYAAAIAWGHSNKAAYDKADRAVIDRNTRWHGKEKTSDKG